MSLRNKVEVSTIKAMIALYCKKKHRQPTICSECKQLEEYALMRIQRCPFGDLKPACSQCEVHCYKSDKREQVKDVMRYSGPRMILYHPFYALLHIFVEILPLPKRIERS
jgi:hypothetical protein